MIFTSSLNLKDFRGIREFREALKFAKFNILIGRNNSGKSAILQALSILPHATRRLPMDVDGNRASLLERLYGDLRSIVYRYAGSASLEFKVKGKAYHAKFDKDGSWRFFVGDKSVDVNTCCERLGIDMGKARDCVAFIPNDSEFLKRIDDRLITEWPLVEKSDAHINVVRDVINKSIDETFTEVGVRYSELYARKDVNGKPFHVRVRDLGDGIEKTLTILLWLEVCSPELVLWDDFEASVHPTLLKLVLEWLLKKDWQVLIATHSIDVLLRLLDIEFNENYNVVLLKKTAEDVLLHKNLDVKGLEDFIMNNQDPRLFPDLLEL